MPACAKTTGLPLRRNASGVNARSFDAGCAVSVAESRSAVNMTGFLTQLHLEDRAQRQLETGE